MFKLLPSSPNFSALEKELLTFWHTENIFHQSLEKRKACKPYIFYDGPPFATGLPHYGHLLASIIKDIIPRYQTMKGNYVERRFGWDCHGLPIEMEMQNKLNLPTSDAIEKLGVHQFNEACRKNVLRYTEEWKATITRIGRWVDFDNSYKTMDASFMESVWWVFKELYTQGLIYEGFKVLPYSWKAETVLSNFESNSNYKSVQDPAITVMFKHADKNEYFLAWTTTPWTLIANLALCVNSTMSYVKVKFLADNQVYVVGKNCLPKIFPDSKLYHIIANLTGSDLIGCSYHPLFEYASANLSTQAESPQKIKNCFRIVGDDFVSDSEGTGIVHTAPAFGEDDYRVCQANDIPLFDPVDESGNFRKEISLVAKLNIKEADKIIIQALKDKKHLFKQDTMQHNYPFCWRTDTPLMYKAISTYFIKIEPIRDLMIKNNSQVKWMPSHIKDGRFGKWLANAKDWAISRNRYWGTPIPIWKCVADGEIDTAPLVFGSIAELNDAIGSQDVATQKDKQNDKQKITDIHKHYMDDIILKKDEKIYHRVSEVLDCWFESGAMPYGKAHYPFANTEELANLFPADFIAEGIDQTRGWFYTLTVIGTALFKKPPYKNVIVNGLILAEDGKKMSKRLKNYPDPNVLLQQYGADATRLYLIQSGAVKGETLRFTETGVKDVIKTIMLPLWNAFSFFVAYANIDKWQPTEELSLHHVKSLNNNLDRWLFSYTQTLIKNTTQAMDDYTLHKAIAPLLEYTEKLTNCYIRRNRRRFWKSQSDSDKNDAYYTLYQALKTIATLLAPFIPFLTDNIYRVLRQSNEPISVHLCDYPVYNKNYVNIELENEINTTENIISLGRALRTNAKIKIRQPLSALEIISNNEKIRTIAQKNLSTIRDELNIKEISIAQNENNYIDYQCKANFRTLGKKYNADVKAIHTALLQLKSSNAKMLIESGRLTLTIKTDTKDDKQFELLTEDVIVSRIEKKETASSHKLLAEGDIVLALNITLTKNLVQEGLARELVNRIQKERKSKDLHYTDKISITFYTNDDALKQAIEKNQSYIQKETLCEKLLAVEKSNSDLIADSLNGIDCAYGIIKL